MKTAGKPKIGLALGGGSIRGFAHIGVLEAFDEAKIPIDFIAGTSIGSAVGAMYACGQIPKHLAEVLPRLDLKAVVPFRPHRTGFLDGKDYRETIELLTFHRNIEETNIPFRAVAVDLISWQKVVLDRGPIGKAVQASSAVPGIFVPVEWGDWLLADGFLLENVPTCVVRNMGADLVIGVDISYPSHTRPKHMIEIMNRALDIATKSQPIAEADYLIAPIYESISGFDLEKAEQCLEMGRRAGAAAIPDILALIESFSQRLREEDF